MANARRAMEATHAFACCGGMWRVSASITKTSVSSAKRSRSAWGSVSTTVLAPVFEICTPVSSAPVKSSANIKSVNIADSPLSFACLFFASVALLEPKAGRFSISVCVIMKRFLFFVKFCSPKSFHFRTFPLFRLACIVALCYNFIRKAPISFRFGTHWANLLFFPIVRRDLLGRDSHFRDRAL